MRIKFITLILVALFALSSLGFAQAARPLIPGDIDRDGMVEPGDYFLVRWLILNDWPFLPNEIEACDMNGDGKCDRRDLSLIAQAAGVSSKSIYIKGKKLNLPRQ